MSIIRPMVRPAVRAATRPSSGLYQSKIVLVDATLRRYMGTFTRNGTATYFGSNGVMQTAAANVPRWQYDPATGQLQGLLIEESRTNIALHSEDFTQWGTTNCSVTANAAISPDGTMSADMIVPTSGALNGYGYVVQNIGISTSTTYTFSCFVKNSGMTSVHLQTSPSVNSTASVQVSFDFASETFTNVHGSPFTSFKRLRNGWYRISVTWTSSSSATGSGTIIKAYGTCDGTNGIYVFGAQFEQGSFPSSYIPTTGSAVTRASDNAVITDLSGFDLMKGTFVLEIAPISANIGANDGIDVLYLDNNNKVSLRNGASSVISGGTTLATLDGFGSSGGKLAFSYGGSSFATCLNSGAVTTGGSGALGFTPTSEDLSVDGQASFPNSTIKSLTYVPYAMTAAQLQAATS